MGIDDLTDEVVKVDLTDPQFYSTERPERVWRTMRRIGCPIRSRGMREHWAVTRYRQVEEVYRNARCFSSEKGMHLGEKPTDDLAGEAAGGMSLLVTDDPAHFEMRKAIGAAFTPRMMQKLAEDTLDTTRRLVSNATTEESIDFVEAVAAPLPAIVICNLLGVPEGDRSHVMDLTHTAFGGGGATTEYPQLAAHAELFGYCDELLTSKRSRPVDDVASVLATATMYGRPIEQEIAVMNCHDLIAGGNETARHASSAAALTMVTHPECWTQLRNGQADMSTATEEILRLEAPVNHVMRVLLEDIEIGGVMMRRGEYVTLWLRSANRDEEIFDNPEELIFQRKPNRHLTFGLGSHFCVAASLARLEVGSVVRALLEIVDHAELTDQPKRLESNFFRGYTKLPLSLTRKR